MARARQLPPVDATVTEAELQRLVERLGHDPQLVARVTFSRSAAGLRATVTYVKHVAPDG